MAENETETPPYPLVTSKHAFLVFPRWSDGDGGADECSTWAAVQKSIEDHQRSGYGKSGDKRAPASVLYVREVHVKEYRVPVVPAPAP
jgi:hypothetical protein